MSKKGGFGKFLAGAALGAGLGVLFAPKKGSATRKELKVKLDEVINNLKEIDSHDVKEEVEKRIAIIKSELEDLDKEKVLKIAKNKVKDIENLCGELANYVVDKGSPILEKTANAAREKAIDVTKEVLKKLEKED